MVLLYEALIHVSALAVSAVYFAGHAPADTVVSILVYISTTYFALNYAVPFLTSLPTLPATVRNDTTLIERAFVAEAPPSVNAPDLLVDDYATKGEPEDDAGYVFWEGEEPTVDASDAPMIDPVVGPSTPGGAAHPSRLRAFFPALQPIFAAIRNISPIMGLVLGTSIIFAFGSAMLALVIYTQSPRSDDVAKRAQSYRRRSLNTHINSETITITPPTSHVELPADAGRIHLDSGATLENVLEDGYHSDSPDGHKSASIFELPPDAMTEWSIVDEQNAASLEIPASLNAPSLEEAQPTIEPETNNGSAFVPTLPLTINDFEMRETLGHGHGGLVRLAEYKRAGNKAVAIKTLNKRLCTSTDDLRCALIEQKVLAWIAMEHAKDETRHPFVVKLLCSFQDEADVHLVLEHHRCDLSMRIADYTALNKAFPRDLLRFYIAELCAAVAVLHADGIIHRDIKPANILIDTDGHLVLADMGMATEPLPMAAAARAPISPAWVRAGDSVAHVHALEARAGTYYYTAPEILMGWQYGSAVDWWSVGAVMCCMWTGRAPFAENVEEDFDTTTPCPELLEMHLVSWTTKVSDGPVTPDDMMGLDRELFLGLLQRNPQLRIDSWAVKHHAFFRSTGYNWDTIASRSAPPPPASFDFRQSYISDDSDSLGDYERKLDEAKDKTAPEDAKFADYAFVNPKGVVM